MKIRIYYEDTDAGGIVYHANYLKYCERARSELFFERGRMPFGEDRSGFVVRRIEADFLGMALLGDLLEVHTESLRQTRSSVRLHQWITRGEETIYSMEILLVYLVDARPRRIPDELLSVLSDLKAQSIETDGFESYE